MDEQNIDHLTVFHIIGRYSFQALADRRYPDTANCRNPVCTNKKLILKRFASTF